MSNNEGYIMGEEEQVRQALDTLRRYGIKRGDSFDIGNTEQSTDVITGFLSNPRQLASSLNLTQSQAENIRSLIVGGGTGAVHKFLSQHLGDEVSAAIGGLISGYIAKRLIGR